MNTVMSTLLVYFYTSCIIHFGSPSRPETVSRLRYHQIRLSEWTLCEALQHRFECRNSVTINQLCYYLNSRLLDCSQFLILSRTKNINFKQNWISRYSISILFTRSKASRGTILSYIMQLTYFSCMRCSGMISRTHAWILFAWHSVGPCWQVNVIFPSFSCV